MNLRFPGNVCFSNVIVAFKIVWNILLEVVRKVISRVFELLVRFSSHKSKLWFLSSVFLCLVASCGWNSRWGKYCVLVTTQGRGDLLLHVSYCLFREKRYFFFSRCACQRGIAPARLHCFSLWGKRWCARLPSPPQKRNMRRTERQKEYVTIAIVMKSREAETNDNKAHVHPTESL